MGGGLQVRATSVNCAGQVGEVFVGTPVPPKGHSCIAPLHLWPHHSQAEVLALFARLSCRSSAASFGQGAHRYKSQGVSVVQEFRVRVVGSGVRRITSRCSDPHNHKVLGRGRGLANLIAIAPRPRADTSARGR
jgi:hypothetical protein